MSLTATPSVSTEPGHIEATPGICGGRPRIRGTRIRVQDIVVWHERMNLSSDEIASRHPQVNLAAIYAALAYYHDHRAEIDQQMQHGNELAAELAQVYPSKVAEKLQP